MNHLRAQHLMARISFAGLLGGCAVAPPSLVDARDAYMTSTNGLAAMLTPADLHEASRALDRANVEFDAHGDTLELRDLAYIAKRKVELADVRARTEADRQRLVEAGQQGVAVRDGQVGPAPSPKAQTPEERAEEHRAGELSDPALRAAYRGHDRQRQTTRARLNAEAAFGPLGPLAADSFEGTQMDLADAATVSQEPRGLIITLADAALFPSGKFALLSTAQRQLDRVAGVLKAQREDRVMVVEGHTDSQGSDSTNQTLSLNRALAVRDALVNRGVPGELISAEGVGSIRPLVDNRTAKSRANNRRMEIIVRPSPLSAR